MANQYLFGGISGMCGILISHPLDTIKTHIQTGNALSNFKPSLQNLYKGITIPLIGIGVEKAIVFGTYNYVNTKTNNIMILRLLFILPPNIFLFLNNFCNIFLFII